MEIDRPEIIAGIGLDTVDDEVITEQKNKESNTYLPFEPLKREVPYLEWNRATRNAENQRGEKICCYSFYSQFIYFQPELNKECVRLNKTNVYNKYAFSASGDYFVAAEKNHIIIWERE